MKNKELYYLMKQHDYNCCGINITYFYLFGWERIISANYVCKQYNCDIEKAQEILVNLYNNNLISRCNNDEFISTDELKYLYPINFFGYSFNEMCNNVFNVVNIAYPLKIERDFIKKFIRKHKKIIIDKLNGYLKKCDKYFSNKYIISVTKNSKLKITNKNNKDLAKFLIDFKYKEFRRFYFLGFYNNYLMNIITQSLVLKSVVEVLIEYGYDYYIVPSILIHKNYEKHTTTIDNVNLKRVIELKPILEVLKCFEKEFSINVFTFDIKTLLIKKL